MRNASFEHYHLPSSMDVPAMTVGHQETPRPYTAYGIKGAGEAGRMLTPAIMSAAIEDALSHLRRPRSLTARQRGADPGLGERRQGVRRRAAPPGAAA